MPDAVSGMESGAANLPQAALKDDCVGIDAIAALENQSVETARIDPGVGCLIDRVYPGRPLLICFGFVDRQGLPQFDFFNRSKKLETSTGLAFNRILLRDPLNLWYQHGVPGLGNNVHEVAARLQKVIRLIRPSETTTIGQSMGGYAAILYGLLLDVERVISFGALSHLDAARARAEGERRWLNVMDMLQKCPPAHWYKDLISVIHGRDVHPQWHFLYGTRLLDTGATNMDYLYLQHYATVPGARISTFREAPHAVVNWLNDAGRTDALLHHMLLDSPARKRSCMAFDDRYPGELKFKRHAGGAIQLSVTGANQPPASISARWWDG